MKQDGDDELIIRAAKAIGLKGEMVGGFRIIKDGKPYYWNPLTNAEDALLLALRLNMDLFFGYGWLNDTKGPTATTRCSDRFEELVEDNNDDILAAALRAITRCAADRCPE